MCKPAPGIAVRLPRLVADRRGTTALLLALVMPVLVGSTALALEVGSWSVTKTYLQRRADMAAYAATLRYQLGDSAQTAATAGINVAALNGARAASPTWSAATNTMTASDVTVALVSGVRDASDRAMRVVVTTSLPLSIGNYFTAQTAVTVSATAYAEITTSTSGGGGGQPCITALKTSGGTGVTIQGGVTVNTPNCTARSNSTFNVTNGSTLNTTYAYANGTVTVSGNSFISNGTSTVNATNVAGWTNAAPLYKSAGTIADPYAGNAAITADFASLHAGQGTAFNGTWQPATLSPGTYSSINSGSGAMTLNPGLYIVNGDINIGHGTTVTGSGVTIVTSGSVTFGGGATVTLSAPVANATTGGIPGILIAGNSTGTDSLSNGMIPTLTGVIYYPNGTMAINGGVHTGNSCLEVLAGSVTISNGANFGGSCSTYGAATFGSMAGTQSTALVQ